MAKKAQNNELAQALEAIAALTAQVQALQSQVIPSTNGKSKGKGKKAQAETPKTAQQIRNEAIRDGLKEFDGMSLAQVINRIAATGSANRKQKTFVNDWAKDKVPTVDLLKYFPVVQRSAFKSAWKAAKKAGTCKSRAQALAMLEKAMK